MSSGYQSSLQVWDDSITKTVNTFASKFPQNVTVCDLYIFQSCLAILGLAPSIFKFDRTSTRAKLEAVQEDLRTHYQPLYDVLKSKELSLANILTPANINEQSRYDKSLTAAADHLIPLISVLLYELSNKVTFSQGLVENPRGNIDEYMQKFEVRVVGFAENDTFNDTFTMLQAGSESAWSTSKLKILRVDEWEDTTFDQRDFLIESDMWKVSTDWKLAVTSVKQVNDQFAQTTSQLHGLFEKVLATTSSSNGHPRLKSTWLEDLLRAPGPRRLDPATRTSMAVDNVFRKIDLKDNYAVFHINEMLVGGTRTRTTWEKWDEVHNILEQDFTRPKIERYDQAMQRLEGLNSGEDMSIGGGYTLETLNKLRIYVITLGIEAFTEFKQHKIQDDQASSQVEKYILPPFRLLNSMIYYFYFVEPQRREFLAQFSQVLMVCMYRLRPVFFNDDLVEYGNSIYRVVDDGFFVEDGESNFNQMQTDVKLVKITSLSGDVVDIKEEPEDAKTKKLKLVTGIDFMKEYGFVLPGCQSLEKYKGFDEGVMKSLLDASIRVHPNYITARRRVSLAMTYYMCAWNLSNILISSMAQVQSWYHINTDERMEMGYKANIGGGGTQPELRGGWNLAKIAQQGWQSLEDWLGKTDGVNAGLLELGSEARADKTTSVLRNRLPNIPPLDDLVGHVAYFDRINFNIDIDKNYQSFVIENFYDEVGIIEKLEGVALAGVSAPFMKQVEGWINHKQSRDVSTKFEVLWRVKQPTAHNYGANADYLFDMIYKRETNGQGDEILKIFDVDTFPERVKRISEGSEKTMKVFSEVLTEPSGNARQSRKDRDALDLIFADCNKIKIMGTSADDRPLKLSSNTMEVVQNDLNAFLDRAVQYMLAFVNPFKAMDRTNFILQVIHILLSYCMSSYVPFNPSAGGNGRPGWVFPVRNYQAKKFVNVKNMDKLYPELDTKFNKEDKPFLPHSIFSNALSKLNSLNISVTNDSQNLSSYSHVTMFVNTIDRILAKLGSVIWVNETTRYVISTSIGPQNVRITLNNVYYGEYGDSLDSVAAFMKRDLHIVAEDMFKNPKNYQMHMPELNYWLNALDDKTGVVKHGEFEMEVSEFRPCMKMYNGKWYYACAWNFPLRILPVLNDDRDKGTAFAKIGCCDCNMYRVTPGYSFGISPSVYHNTKKLRKQLSKVLDTTDTKALHAKTNYEMMFAKPLKYHLDIMPLYVATIGFLLNRGKTRTTKDALGNPRNQSLGQTFSDLGSWMSGVSNSVKDFSTKVDNTVFTVTPTKYSKAIVSNIIYIQFTGCYYVPRGIRRLQGGEDTIGALQLAQNRDSSQIRPQRGEMYPTYDLKKMGVNVSPIVYSIFYMFNGIMGIRGDLSPYIFPYYEACNVSQSKGHSAFVQAFFANKDQARGFNIDSKMAALDLNYPTRVDQPLGEAQDAGVKNQKDSSSSSSTSDGLSDEARSAMKAAGLLGLFGILSKCMSNQDLSTDHRETCEDARSAIKMGVKDNFKQGWPNSHGWERTMKKYNDYFAKKGKYWTDAHDVNTNLRRYDRAGNLIKRYDKGYNTSSSNGGMSYRQGNDRNERKRSYGNTDLERDNQRLKEQLNEKQRDGMMNSRMKHREASKKHREGGALNWEFTDAQGNMVFKMLPHNIVANVLLLAFAGLTAWGASAGTSTYTRLLDVEFRKGNGKLEDLAALQPSRMACSFFFGMGLGIFVAFIASMVEMANHKRVRQALFILLVAVPIIVMGVIGVQGANKMCMENPDKVCEKNFCKMDNVSQKGTCTWGGVNCNQDTDCKVNYCDPSSSKCHFSGVDCDLEHNATTPTTPSSLNSAPTKRGRYMPASKKTRLPKLKAFYNSLMGTHAPEILGDDPTCDTTTKTCSNAQGTSCQDDEDCKLPENAVLKDQVKASDYLFMGLGAGVLVAGICTILPDNPFHPSRFDVEYQSNAQSKFTTVSQVNPKWWAFGLIFSMIMAGGGISSAILTHTTVPVTTDDNDRDVRKSGQVQSFVAIGAAVVLFAVIVILGWWHLKRHRKVGTLMENYGSGGDRGERSGTAAGQLARK